MLLVVIAGCGEANRCGPSSGTVERVIDGDTIELSSGERVRYLLIDTPENTTEVECFGPEATAYNAELALGREVELAYGDECEDRYGRLLAYVSLGDREINTLLVERGYACVLYIPPNGSDRAAEFAALEDGAQAANRGLWAACEDIPCN